MSPSLRERLSGATDSLKSRFRQDARAAERGVSDRARNLRQRVANADRGDARRIARRAGETLESIEVDSQSNLSASERESFAAAEDAATMGSPVDATLDPVTSPEDVHHFVTGPPARRGDPADRTQDGVGTIDEMATGPMGSMDDFLGFGNDPEEADDYGGFFSEERGDGFVDDEFAGLNFGVGLEDDDRDDDRDDDEDVWGWI